ncbi:MAG TPA: hypothetical protein VF043_33375 [Ktedonobacteraceae bacterium]
MAPVASTDTLCSKTPLNPTLLMGKRIGDLGLLIRLHALREKHGGFLQLPAS